MYTPSKERARVIRKALVEKFGRSSVKVRKGRGTASSWVEAGVETERPQGCTCQFSTTYWNGKPAPKPYRSTTYCPACLEEYRRVEKLLSSVAEEAMKGAGYEHSTFTSDDTYYTEYSEFLTSVSVK